MKNLRRLAGFVLAAALAAVVCVIPAAAASVTSGKLYHKAVSTTFEAESVGDGDLIVVFNTENGASGTIELNVYDPDGERVEPSAISASLGTYDSSSNKFRKGQVQNDIAGRATYKVSEGTYKIKFSGSGKIAVKITFPHVNTAKGSKKKADISGSQIVLNVQPKTVISLSAFFDGAAEKAKWSSSDTKVASVDLNGKVTAKSEGTAVITAEKDGTSISLAINVKK